VSRADIIAVSVDCASHEAARLIKRLTAQLGKPWHPLRSASLAALAQALGTTITAPPHTIRHDDTIPPTTM
jgi:hypothetical protein